jgi:hypothetical protein
MANLNLADLLRYKEEIEIIDPRTGKGVSKIWLRVLGDLDLTIAYKEARLASANKRDALRDPESKDYKDEVLGVADLTIDEQKDIIKASRLSSIVNEASLAVDRPELPKIEEVAVEPDAPNLEELEKFDKLEMTIEEEYGKKIDEYIEQRTQILDAELDQMSEEEVLKTAQTEVTNIIPFSLFLTELNALKVFLGAYNNKDCTDKTFNTLDEFKQLPKTVQEQLIVAMNNLEISGPAIKN